MEALILVALAICMALLAYIAFKVHGMTSSKLPASAKVTEALNERVSVIMASLTEEEWEAVRTGNTSILVAKAAYTRTDAAVRDGLIKQLKEIEASYTKVAREYASNAADGYSGLADISKNAMDHLEAKAEQLRGRIAKLN